MLEQDLGRLSLHLVSSSVLLADEVLRYMKSGFNSDKPLAHEMYSLKPTVEIFAVLYEKKLI